MDREKIPALLLLTFLVHFVAGCGVAPCPDFDFSSCENDPAFKEAIESGAFAGLAEATCVQSMHVGASGMLAKSAYWFSVLYHGDREGEVFARLFNEARTVEGHVYALAGLFLKNRQEYEKRRKCIADDRKVCVQNCCFVSRDRYREVRDSIEDTDMAQEMILDPLPDEYDPLVYPCPEEPEEM